MKKKFPHSPFQVLILIVCSIILTSPIAFFHSRFMNFLGNDTINLIYFCIFIIIAVGLSIIINKKRNQDLAFSFGKINLDVLFTSTVILILFHIGLNQIVAEFLVKLFNVKNTIRPDLINPTLLIGSLVIAPVLEEIFFRGIVLEGLLSRYKTLNAILLTTIIFAICHWNIVQSVHSFFIGGLISYIYTKDRSLKMSAILHFLNNLIGLTFTHWRFNHQLELMSDRYSDYMAIVSLSSTILLLIAIRRLLKKHYSSASI